MSVFWGLFLNSHTNACMSVRSFFFLIIIIIIFVIIIIIIIFIIIITIIIIIIIIIITVFLNSKYCLYFLFKFNGCKNQSTKIIL